jgi:hypothetical protein
MHTLVPQGAGNSARVWQLLQVRHLHDTPLVFAGSMWKGLVEWASSQMLRPRLELESAQDMQILRCVDGGAEALAVIKEHHERWMSAQGVEAID